MTVLKYLLSLNQSLNILVSEKQPTNDEVKI